MVVIGRAVVNGLNDDGSRPDQRQPQTRGKNSRRRTTPIISTAASIGRGDQGSRWCSRARQGNKFKFRQPTPLFKVPLGTLRSDIEQYATNDGKRFLFLKAVDRRPRPINVVINWPMAIKAHNQP